MSIVSGTTTNFKNYAAIIYKKNKGRTVFNTNNFISYNICGGRLAALKEWDTTSIQYHYWRLSKESGKLLRHIQNVRQ